MVMLRRFSALRPPAMLARAVSAPPYDVVSTDEARALAEGNPESFLHVSRAEIDLDPSVDQHAFEVHARAAENLRAMVSRGTLVRDETPSLYVYAQTRGSHRQVGVVGCASVAEYRDGVIRKHENTRADKEDDRTRHLEALGAHDEPVFLAYRAVSEIDTLVSAAIRERPTYDFVADDGVGHTLWVLDRDTSAALEALFASHVRRLYIADGHHRSAAAERVAAKRQGEVGDHGVFPVVVFPAEQLEIMGYHRVVRDHLGRSPTALREALSAVMSLTPTDNQAPTEPGTVGIYLDHHWWRASFTETVAPHDPVASLDVSRLQETVLAGVFGITDPRRDPRVDFVGGVRGTEALAHKVDTEGWSIAVAMYPTLISQLIEVSDASRLMPPKSTWFEPKLRSGLFVHEF